MLANVRERYSQRVDYVLMILHLVRLWAACADKVQIIVVIGRIRIVRREQLDFLDRWRHRLPMAFQVVGVNAMCNGVFAFRYLYKSAVRIWLKI